MPASNRIMLIVDDEPSIVATLQRELRSWARSHQMELAGAGSPAEALAYLDQHAHSVIVLLADVRMPGGKGTDLLLRVKELYPTISGLLLTAYADMSDVAKAISAGAAAYILKPWQHDYLVAELDKVLQAHDLREQNRRYQERLLDDLRWAGELQAALLEVPLPRTAMVSFDVLCEPLAGQYCGGDFYDLVECGEDRYVLFVGDVSGHGVRAALVTALLKSLVRGLLTDPVWSPFPDPGSLLRVLSERVYRALERVSDVLVTFCACALDVAAGRLLYASAGHPPPVLVRAGDAHELPAEGTVMGVTPDSVYEAREKDVRAGDILIVYSDGLIERGHGAAGEGLRALCAVAARTAPGKGYAQAIRAASAPPEGFADDITILAAAIAPAALG